jgi:putative ABC transport system permease protein
MCLPTAAGETVSAWAMAALEWPCAINAGTTRLRGVRRSPRWAATVTDRQADQTRVGLLVMIGIAAVYGAIGAVATAATAISGRRRELALLRRIGTTRRQAVGFVCQEYALLSAAGALTAAGAAAIVLIGLHLAA